VAFIFREIADAVRKSLEEEKEQLMAELRSLHTRLERGEIDEAAFSEREAAILDRLDKVQADLDA
jgi:hypothetical protein